MAKTRATGDCAFGGTTVRFEEAESEVRHEHRKHKYREITLHINQSIISPETAIFNGFVNLH
jgi:hypothetical protein